MCKLIFPLSVVFLIVACSGGPKPASDSESKNFEYIDLSWDVTSSTDDFKWDFAHGFRPNKDHLWGFDKHTQPSEDADKITYASVIEGGSGYVNVYINRLLDEGYTYYICDPKDTTVHYFDISLSTDSLYPYGFVSPTSDTITVGLCKSYAGSTYIAQTMRIVAYPDKAYDFRVALLGSDTGGVTKEGDAGQLFQSTDFWEGFDSVYSQAVVRHGSIQRQKYWGTEITGSDSMTSNVLMVSVKNGDVQCYSKAEDDITPRIEDEKALIRSGSTFPRVFMPFILPTKKIWNIVDSLDEIKVCGTPEIDPTSYGSLELISPASKGCSYQLYRTINWNGKKWTVKNDSGNWVPATKYNVDVGCLVMAESGSSTLSNQYLSRYFNTSSSNPLATTLLIFPENSTPPYSPSDMKGKLALIPWRGRDTTARMTYHELGHTMGLWDVLELEGLPLAPQDNSSEGNLMHSYFKNGMRLRFRDMTVAETGTLRPDSNANAESQWDCLQRREQISGLSTCGYDYPDFTK